MIKVTAAARRVVRQGGATLLFSAAGVEPERLLTAVELGGAVLSGARHPSVLALGSTPDLAYVSEPLSVPDGVVITLDTAGLEPAEAETVVETLVAAMTSSDIADATITVPAAKEPHYVNPPQHGVTLWMVARQAVGEERLAVDVALEDAALEWLYAALPAGSAQVTVGGALVPMQRTDARGLLRRPWSPIRMHQNADVAAVNQSFRVVGFSRIRFSADQPRCVALSVGGRGLAVQACVSAAEQFRTMASERARDLSWAAVQVSPFGEPAPWLPPGRRMESSPEDHLGEPHWWQLLTAGHLSRMTDLPSEAARLADHAVAIQFGEVPVWLDNGTHRSLVHARAAEVLGPALPPRDL